MVSRRKVVANKCARTKISHPGSPSLHSTVQVFVARENNTVVAYLYKQGNLSGGDEQPRVETSKLVPLTQNNTDNKAHPGLNQCDG